MSDHARDESVDALRRRLLQAGAGAAALTTLPAFSPASAQAPFDWKQFKGEKIEVNLTKSPRGELLHQVPEGIRGADRHRASAPRCLPSSSSGRRP